MATAAQRKGQIIDPDNLEPTEDIQSAKAEVEEVEDTDLIDDMDDEESLSIEDMDDNEELFPGGPKGIELKAWKQQFNEIYVTSFDSDLHVVWRTLNRFEYRNLVQSLEQSLASGAVTQATANLNNEEAMCERCVLFPKMTRSDSISFPAGVASTIAQEVMEASAFVPLEVRRL